MERVIGLEEERNRPMIEEPVIEGVAVEIETPMLEARKDTGTRLGSILKKAAGMVGIQQKFFGESN